MKKLLSIILTLCVGMLLASPAFAQKTVTVTGKVIDSKGEPLVGAVVMVKGTSTGAMVAADGTYSVNAKSNATLEVTMLGFATATELVDGRTVINFNMKDDAMMLEEAVVEVGYGEQRLVDVTGTVSRVNVDDLVKAPVVSLDQALQGRVAGLSVTSADGQPGSDMNIVIRGTNSLTQDNSPLYVVDGFAIEDFSTSAVSPADIASVTVLKDASATAIYGSRAANGVIIIETKKGKLGKATVSYSGQFGVHQAAKTMELMNPYEFVVYQIERDAKYFDSYLTKLNRTLDDYINYNGVDWQDRMFRNAFVMDHNISLIGGTKQTRYSASANIVDQQGVINNSGYKKYQGRFSLEQQLGKNWRFNVNGSYTYSEVNGQPSAEALQTSNAYTSYLMYRVWGYRPVSTSGVEDDEELFDEDYSSNASTMNPVISNENEQSSKKTSNVAINCKLDWKFAPGWKLSIRGGYTEKFLRHEEFNNSLSLKGFPRASNSLGVNGLFKETRTMNIMNENVISYDNTFNKVHKLGVMVGNTIQAQKKSIYGFSTSQVPVDDLGISGMDTGIPQTATATLSENKLLSFYGRVNYGYDNRYLLTVTFRADGSSKFAKGHQWGFFPSAALAWRFSEESFLKDVNWLSDGKIRVSYGSTGNNRVSDYASYATLALGDYYPFNNTPAVAITQSTIGNEDLTWETTDQLDLGLEAKFLDSRLNFVLDLYRKDTRDLLLNAQIPYSSGFTTAYKNVGKVRNEGVEFTLTAVPVRTRNFIWTADFNISFNKDTVLELAEGQESLTSPVKFTADYNNAPLYIAQVGKSIASFYGYQCDGLYQIEDFDINTAGQYVLKSSVPTNGDTRSSIQPGDIKYVDQNGDGVVNENDQVVIGRAAPICIGGFNNNFTYKGLSLNIFFQWSAGNQIMNANRIVFEGNYNNRNINQFRSYNDHWTYDNQDSNNFRVGGQGPKGMYSDRTLEDGSFLRLKTLQLCYSLPKKWVGKLKMSEITFNIAGQNLWTWTNYTGLDPEVSTQHSALTPGFDYSSYARNRVFTGGVKLVF